jgi:membrane protein DedA with SNARE-associated domain
MFIVVLAAGSLKVSIHAFTIPASHSTVLRSVLSVLIVYQLLLRTSK